MHAFHYKRPLIGLMAGLILAGPAGAEDALPSREEMWRVIQAQQKEIDALKAAQAGAEKRVAATEEKVEATGAAVAQQMEKPDAASAGWWNKTSIGGYGEMHYNGGRKDEIDFHRFVLFVEHQFTDDIRFVSEVELEHSLSGEGKKGAVELEQAYLEFDLSGKQKAQTGVFLLPLGILNETHEPPAFFGVERNAVETNIIPTTWWEGGVQLLGELGSGFSYNAAVHSGLDVATTGANAFRPRNGRQNVSEAPANDPAMTARLRWNGMPGVELAVSGQYQNDITQNAQDVDAYLVETHADLRRGPWGLRALYARWEVDGAAARSLGRDEQYGWYAEPSYRFDVPLGELGFFARYSRWDNAAGDGIDSKFDQTQLGMNFWPHPDIVLKADYQFDDAPASTAEDDRFNLGVGMQF
ncbi:MAG: porin [Pseudomonadota bacterium]